MWRSLFLHTLLVRSLATTLMISLPFNSYLQGVKTTEGCFWIRGGISASLSQEHGMPSPLGASLAAIKCSAYFSQGGGRLKALSFHKAKLKIKGEKVSQIYYDNFHFLPPCFLLACTENVQLNSETFLDILSLELGINVGNIWDFPVLSTDFFL